MAFQPFWTRAAVPVLLLLAACGQRPLDTASIEEALRSVQEEVAPDPRIRVFEIRWEAVGNKLRLTGRVFGPSARDKVIAALSRVSTLPLDESILVLPDPALKGDDHALVNVSVGNLRRDPRQSAELISQVLMGTELQVLEKQEGWCRVQGPDGYLGWIEEGSIRTGDASWIRSWVSSGSVRVHSLHAVAVQEPREGSPVVSDMVVGARVVRESSEGGWALVRLPDGSRGYVRKQDLEEIPAAAEAVSGDAIEATALRFLGIPYLWGGTSPNGLDCSGLVQRVYWLNGVQLPRDADQQAAACSRVDPGDDWSGLHKGDLLFFGRPVDGSEKERVTHVAISLGRADFIHASIGRVRIGSLDRTSPRFDRFNHERYLRAGRPRG